MKNFKKIVAAIFCLAVFSQVSNAQVSAGVDLTLPMGSFSDAASLGFGASVGYDHAIGDNMKVGGQAGYTYFAGKRPESLNDKDDWSSSYSFVPILGNFKYYFTDNTNGVYGIASIGVTIYGYKWEHSWDQTNISWNNGWVTTTERKTDSDNYSDTFLTYGFGAGYLINEKIDLTARYIIVSGNGGSAGALNLRVAYNF